MLGSGEEKFCAQVLRRVSPAAERRGLVKDWNRGVTALILGDAGEAMSQRLPFDKTVLTKAAPALSLAFASVIEAFAEKDLGGSLPVSDGLLAELARRPLFGLEPDGDLVRWGGRGKAELKDLGAYPLIAAIRAKDLDVIGLSGSAWAE